MTNRTLRRATFGVLVLGWASIAAAQPVPPARLSVATDGTQANAESRFVAMSRDGRQVLLSSAATNLVAGDTSGVADLFIRDRDTDRDGVLDEPDAVRTFRVTEGLAGEQTTIATTAGVLSADGRIAVFSTAAALVAGDTNGLLDVYVRDRDADGDGVFDEPGAVTVTRASTTSAGGQADGESVAVQMTADGRFVGFRSTASNLHGRPITVAQLYRKDRLTGQLTTITAMPDGTPADRDPGSSLSLSADGRHAAFAGGFDALSPGGFPWVLRDLQANTFTPIPQVTQGSSYLPATAAPLIIPFASAGPGFIGDRLFLSWGSTFLFPISISGTIQEVDVATGTVLRTVRGLATAEYPPSLVPVPGLAADETLLHASRISESSGCVNVIRELDIRRYDPRTRRITVLVPEPVVGSFSDARGRRLLYGVTDCNPGSSVRPVLLDTDYGVPLPMPDDVRPGFLDAEGTQAVFTTADATILAPGADTNGVADIFAVDLASRFDRDADTLDDRWEIAMGLDYTSAAGPDGAAGDPDGDGQTNAQELAAQTHPRGTGRQFLAEGADNAFFKTRLALANPGGTAATAVVRLDGDAGASKTINVPVPAGRNRVVFLDEVGPPSSSFATVIESSAPLVAERTVSWDATEYGAHAERASAAPSTSWFLAEGATGGFSLFYLLQNPGETAATATIRYLRPSPLPPIERTYPLPPHSRVTLPVNLQAPELAGTDVSAAITATQPILVERAMYRSVGGQAFAAGHASAGVTAASTDWFLAEGATGDFFDLFILLANPSLTPATVEIRYLLGGGTVLTKTYTVAAESRRTIYVDGETFGTAGQALANAALSSAVHVTNGVPIVVERAMWFPGPAISPVFWTEAHNSPGATATATRWVLADGEAGGPRGAQTFVLIANASATAGRVRVTALPDSPTALPPTPIATVVDLPPNSRTTVPMHAIARLADSRFGVLVESIDTTPLADLVVERAMYWNAGGVIWAAGTNLLATPVP